MQNILKKIDAFTRNIIVVFTGTALLNLFNLLYQLLIAHKFSPSDFAAFNALLSIFMLISSPFATLQVVVAKYCAEFNAQGQRDKVTFLLSDFFKKIIFLSAVTLAIFFFASGYITNTLKVPSLLCGYILAGLLALSWFIPLLLGGAQGLEFFGWMSLSSVAGGILKLAIGILFIFLGYNIAGALGALLISTFIGLSILYLPLRNFIHLGVKGRPPGAREGIEYKSMFSYLIPVGISYFCFMALVSIDMVLVRHFFAKDDSGLYSLAQMVGKIFLFLPGAISIVLFPKTSGLNARDMDTTVSLKKSLFYGSILCAIAAFGYNIFPAFVLKVLTGKSYLQAVTLGRLFSVSMTCFALLYILITYFLSINYFGFIKYLVLFTLWLVAAIILFHKTLYDVQMILCMNAVLLLVINLVIFVKRNERH